MRSDSMIAVAALCVGLFAAGARAEPPKPLYAGEWVTISDGILAELEKEGKVRKEGRAYHPVGKS